MTDHELLDQLMVYTYTRAAMFRRLRFLRTYLEKQYYSSDSGIPIVEYMTSVHVSESDDAAYRALGDGFYKSFTKETAYQLLGSIEELVKKIPVLNLYIPFEPDSQETVKLGKWFRTSLSESHLLDIHADPGLLGGCAFAWKGYYKDYSLRYYFLRYRDAIIEMVNKYAGQSQQNS